MKELRPKRSSRGQALVEFALVLPLFLLLIFGIVDAGRLIFTYNTVANSARDAARVAIVNQSTAGTNTCDTTGTTYPVDQPYPKGCAIVSGLGLQLTAADVCVNFRSSTAVAPNPCVDGGTAATGSIAMVRVTGRFQALTPIIGQIIGPMSVSSTSEIPVERKCTNPPPAPLVSC